MKTAMVAILTTIWVVALAGVSLIGPSQSIAGEGLTVKTGPGPVVVVATPRVKMSNKAEVIIMGTGFQPGQEVRLLFTAVDEVQSDIGYALKPEPVAGKTGEWITTWRCGRLIKKKLIKEALRVVKKGGWFALQDLFLWKRVYGEVDDLLETIRSWGIETVEFVDTSDSDFIPNALKLPFMLGTVGILYGRK